MALAFRDLAALEKVVEMLVHGKVPEGHYRETGFHITARAEGPDIVIDAPSPDAFSIEKQYKKNQEREDAAEGTNPDSKMRAAAREAALAAKAGADASTSAHGSDKADSKTSTEPTFKQTFKTSTGEQWMLTTHFFDRVMGPSPNKYTFPGSMFVRAFD